MKEVKEYFLKNKLKNVTFLMFSSILKFLPGESQDSVIQIKQEARRQVILQIHTYYSQDNIPFTTYLPHPN
jgi:hypothetical protein